MSEQEKQPWQPEVVDPEPLADTDYTRSTGTPAAVAGLVVPVDVQETAAGLVAWIGDDPERATAAKAVNDGRDHPWKTVTERVDALLG